jgi:hypothetical protein
MVFCWNGIYSKDKELLNQLRELAEANRSILLTDCSSSLGYDYKYLGPIEDYAFNNLAKVSKESFYSTVDLDTYKEKITKYKSDKAEYEKQKEIYKKSKTEEEEVTGYPLRKIYSHKRLEVAAEQSLKEFEKYFKIAEENFDIAMSFFEKAFVDELGFKYFEYYIRVKYEKPLTDELIELDINDIVDTMADEM